MTVDDGEMRRLGPLLQDDGRLTGGDGGRIASPGGTDTADPVPGIVPGRQRQHGSIVKIRVPQVPGPVGKHPLGHLGEQMDLLRGVQRRSLQQVQHVEELQQGHAAGGRRCHGVDGVLPIPAHEGRPPARFIALQVGGRDQAATPFHLRHQQGGRAPGVELLRPLFGDALQGRRQVRQAHRAALVAGVVVVEFAVGAHALMQRGKGAAVAAERPGGPGIDAKALPGQADGRLQQRLPGQRTVALP